MRILELILGVYFAMMAWFFFCLARIAAKDYPKPKVPQELEKYENEMAEFLNH